MQISKTKSGLQQQPEATVVEIQVEDFTRILRANFSIYSELIPGKKYAVRYTGEPYDQSNADCRSVLVYAHAKGQRLSPLNILAVLSKFELSIDEYNEAIAGQGKLLKFVPQSAQRPHES
jgi:hypothetical protein